MHGIELFTKWWQLDCKYFACVCVLGGRSSISQCREEALVCLACCCLRSERRRKGPSLEGFQYQNVDQPGKVKGPGLQEDNDVMRNFKYARLLICMSRPAICLCRQPRTKPNIASNITSSSTPGCRKIPPSPTFLIVQMALISKDWKKYLSKDK